MQSDHAKPVPPRRRGRSTRLGAWLLLGLSGIGLLLVEAAGRSHLLGLLPIALASLAAIALGLLLWCWRGALGERPAGPPQAAHELQLMAQRYRALLENSAELLAEVDSSLRLGQVSLSLQRLLGQGAEELNGVRISGFSHPAEAEGQAALVRSALAENRAVGSVSRIRDRFGHWRWLEWTASPIGTPSGPRRLLFVARDVTERRHSEEVLHQLVESAPDALVVVDTDGKIIRFNGPAEAMFEYTRDEAVGQTVELLIPERYRARHVGYRNAFLAEGRSRRMAADRELFGVRKSGTEFPVEINLSRIHADGETRIVASIRDITDRLLLERERRAVETQMLHVQKLESLGVLAGGIAHDFNNLLGGIVNYADLAQLRLDEESPAHECIDGIKRSARRMAELSNQMLIYAGKGRVRFEPTDLTEVVDSMRSLLEASLSKKASIRYDLDRSLPATRGDRSQLGQIVMNLVTNASEALEGSEGTITIRTRVVEIDRDAVGDACVTPELAAGEFVCLEVEDPGCGMDEHTKAHFVDPFFTTKREGRGLGMATVLGIVRRHGGGILVDTAPGEGCTVRILLPSAPDAVRRAPAPGVSRRATGAERSGTLLLIDDEELVREPVRKGLEGMGYRVLAAADGQAGVRLFAEDPEAIDAVILDMTMPKLSGAEVVRELRSIDGRARVVLCSGYSSSEALAVLDEGPELRFLQKPYEFTDLLETIDALLE